MYCFALSSMHVVQKYYLHGLGEHTNILITSVVLLLSLQHLDRVCSIHSAKVQGSLRLFSSTHCNRIHKLFKQTTFCLLTLCFVILSQKNQDTDAY